MIESKRPFIFKHQRGIVVLWAVIFLIVGVMITLTQVYDIAGSRGVATMQQGDSTAAFFAAESGLQRASSIISKLDPITGTSCSITNPKFNGTSPYDVGSSGSFVLSAICFDGTVQCDTCVPCNTCVITSTGKSGNATRTTQRAYTVELKNGVTCNGASPPAGYVDCSNATAPPPAWSLSLTNPTAFPSLAVFHLASTRKGGKSTGTCPPGSNCAMQWLVRAPPGNNSVFSMGNVYSIGANETTPVVYQIVDETGNATNINEDIAETGVFFAGNEQPSLVGSYWNEQQNGDGTKGGSGSSTGLTNNGAMTSSGTCSDATEDGQSCTKWCYDGDILIFSFAGGSEGQGQNPPTGTTDRLSNVRFNTASGGQNIPLTYLAHFPDAATPNAPLTVYSEMWFKRNPSYLYGAKIIKATINNDVEGATFKATTDAEKPNKITVSDCSSSINWLEVGDTITAGNGIPSGTKVTATPDGTDAINCQIGDYTVDKTVTTDTSTANRTSTRTVLNVNLASDIDGGTIVVGQTLSGAISGTSITGNRIVAMGTGTGTAGTYYLNAATAASPLSFTASNTVKPITAGATSSGNTITVPNTTSLNDIDPAIGTNLPTILAVRSGTGEFAPGWSNATVTAVSGNTITISADLETDLAGAQICAGTCAFFNHDNNYTYIGTGNPPDPPDTLFSFTKATNTRYWASGFTCMKGVDIDPSLIQKPTVIQGRWSEPVP